MVYRCILPQWAVEECPQLRRVQEGQFSEDEILSLNEQFYNIYYLPNSPTIYDNKKTVDGADIDAFNYVFIDMDLKEGKWASKENFIDHIQGCGFLPPSSIVDSGNGVHVYWKITDLDAISYLKISRRLIRKFKTDEAVGQIFQLMRVPGTVNTKKQEEFVLCQELFKSDAEYSCEDLDKALPPLTPDDLNFCTQHFDRTYNKEAQIAISTKLPLKFAKLMRNNEEVKEIWLGQTDDRSKADFRLAHLMYASGFSQQEAASVLVNTTKALMRAPRHQQSYAMNIIDKIWQYEETGDEISQTVAQIISRPNSSLKGTRFPCYSWLDNTEHGFRTSQVIGLVAGSGVGKTALALNMFKGFVEFNPDYDHFFVALEQPANEIAERWKTMCGDNTALHDKVHVISNYAEDGTFRQLSFDDLKEHALAFKKRTGRKIGCYVIDHIGALKKKNKAGENQDIMDICHYMKGFAVELDVLLVMQSQSSREKAGIGDLELNKDAAYGTMYFEAYCDYLITMWQPLKRCYDEPSCPSVTAFKFCKIRHKKRGEDKIQEDVPYKLSFDPKSETMVELTEIEEKSFKYFIQRSTNKRKADRKTDIVSYTSALWSKGDECGKTDNDQDSSATT